MYQRFKNWCRLCAKSEGCTRDVLVRDETTPDLRSTIEKHFSLQIEINAEAPTTICDECYECLLKFIEFEEIVLRSQSAFECSTIIESIKEEDTFDIKIDISHFYTENEEETPQEETIDLPCTPEKSYLADTKKHPASKLICDICGAKFGKAFSLRNHRKLVHSNIRPFICDECGKAFKRSGDLTRHKEFHRDDTPFACTICEKRFTSKLVVKMHEKNHNVEKYTCNVCGQELKTKHTLRGHMQTHSDQLQFECKYCTKKFRYKKNLNCHLLTHTGLQPYSCAFCNQAFSLRWNCRTHQKKFHPVEMTQYEQEKKSTIITHLVKQKFACGRRQTIDSAEIIEEEFLS